jgi:uncharacterized membrane protein
MFFDILFKLLMPIAAIWLSFTTWREYRRLEVPDRRALLGLVAIVFFTILSIIGSVLYFINLAKFKYNPFLYGWLLAYCTSYLTAPKYTANPSRFRTVAAIGGIVLVVVGIVVVVLDI